MLDIVKDRIKTLKDECDATAAFIGQYTKSEEYKNAKFKDAADDLKKTLETESMEASIRLKLYDDDEEIKKTWDNPALLFECLMARRKYYMSMLYESIKTDETKTPPTHTYNRAAKVVCSEILTLERIFINTYEIVSAKDDVEETE